MSKKLLPLTNDLIFKAILGTDEEILMDLLNSFPTFRGNKSFIKNPTVIFLLRALANKV